MERSITYPANLAGVPDALVVLIEQRQADGEADGSIAAILPADEDAEAPHVVEAEGIAGFDVVEAGPKERVYVQRLVEEGGL